MPSWTQADVDRVNAKRGEALPAHLPPKRAKYGNVKTAVGDDVFDSKREADYWLLLKARESLGEIRELKRQVRYPLYAARYDITLGAHVAVQVAEYVADFQFIETSDERVHCVDAKGIKTRMFALKAKWLYLQESIIVECV